MKNELVMNVDKIENIMCSIGFTRYEARAYAALVIESPLTGYELSKQSGIPGSKIYECIDRLVRKELIMPVSDNPARYVAVPPEELVRRLSSDFDQSLTTLKELLKKKAKTDTVEYIFNINGYDEIIGKAREMAERAEQSLDCSLWDSEASELAGAFSQAVQRGVKVRHLSFGEQDIEGTERYCHKVIDESDTNGRWITVVADNSEALTGQCSGDNVVAAWTRNPCLVFTSQKYIEHEIIKIQSNL